MNIAKALKIKNRYVGEINQLKTIFNRTNSWRDDNKPTTDQRVTFDEISKKTQELIKIKAAIQKASAGIADKLVEIAELKDQLVYFTSLAIQEGPTSFGFGDDRHDINYVSWLTQEGRDNLVKSLQEKINSLQDEIDEYNASTQVEVG